MTKNRVIQIRVTDDDYAAIKAFADQQDRTVSEWCRRRLIEAKTVLRNASEYEQPTTTTAVVVPPESQALIDRHAQRTVRKFQPYTKAMQAGRKAK